jgi:DNA mismatch endonuclease (patch repair protein)
MLGSKNPSKRVEIKELISKKVAESYEKNPNLRRLRGEVSRKLLKGKTYEQLYGPQKAAELKKQQSIMRKGKKFSEEHNMKIALARSRQVFPSVDSQIEVVVKNELKKRGISFESQYPVYGLPDIAIPHKKVAIFCDGCYWHGCPVHFPYNKKTKDEYVNMKLQKAGWKVLRFWECEIKNNLPLVINKILEALGQ